MQSNTSHLAADWNKVGNYESCRDQNGSLCFGVDIFMLGVSDSSVQLILMESD